MPRFHPGVGGGAASIAQKNIAFNDWFSPSIVSYPSNLSPNRMADSETGKVFGIHTTRLPSGQVCQSAAGEFTG